MARPLHNALQLIAGRLAELRRLGPDRGVALFITTASMTVLMGFAALGIDVAQWYQKRHQAQISADAAALAAANCLANAASGSTCSATTDTTAANNVATTIAQDNKVPVAGITYGSTNVTVTVSTTAPVYFAGMFKIGSPKITQTATAGYKQGYQAGCTSTNQTAGNCYAIFAMDETCKSDTGKTGSDVGVTFPEGGLTLNGGVHSNGSIFGGDNNHFGFGSIGNQCGTSPNYDYTDWSANWFNAASTPTAMAPITSWPVDYTKDFPSCGAAAGQTACNSSGTPQYCSASAPNFTFSFAVQPQSGYIYCAYGTGTRSNPATWNGQIYLGGGGYGGTATNPRPDTFVAGNVYWSGGGYYYESCGYSSTGYSATNCQGAPGQTIPTPPLCSSTSAPYPCNYPAIYATDTDAQSPLCANSRAAAVCLWGGNEAVMGDIFAASGGSTPPSGSGTVFIDGGSSFTTMIEAYDVIWLNGAGAIGDGPNATGTGSTTSGSDALTN
jgi:Flp pilus assembly protein TadG